MLDIELYRDNAAKRLPPDIHDSILIYMDRLAENRHQAYSTNLELWEFYGEQLMAIRHFLDYLGIYVGYDWVGHRNKHFYITEQDVINQEDWMEQCADYDEEC